MPREEATAAADLEARGLEVGVDPEDAHVTAGPGSEPHVDMQLVQLEPSREADLRTANAIEHASNRTLQQVVVSQRETIEALQRCLERWQSRSVN
jgi:hypothetical protein